MTFHWPKEWTPAKFKEYKTRVDQNFDREAYDRHRAIPNYILHRELCDRLDELESIVEQLEYDRDILWEDNLRQNKHIVRLNKQLGNKV